MTNDERDIYKRLDGIEGLLLTLIELEKKQVEVAPDLARIINSVTDQMRAINAEMALIKERLAATPPVQH